MLDTARFRTLLGSACGVDPQHVHAYVIGEHGDSEVLTWSQATVAGLKLDDFCGRLRAPLTPDERAQIDAQVRGAAYQIIASKGATYYGIGSAVARLVEVLLHNQRSILTVSCLQHEPGNLAGLTLSLPHLVGGAGVITPLLPPLEGEEERQFSRSTAILRETVDSLGLAAALP
jgi:L-lactate dehydrogenase